MLEASKNGTAGRLAERAVGERSQSAGASASPPVVPDPELVQKARRRRFTAEYKLRVLTEADACSKSGEVGALLRREGLYSSLLTEWRRQRERGALEALERPRGRPKADPRERELADLRRRADRAEAELVKARKVIEVQGKVSALLEDLLKPSSAKDESTER